MAFQNYAEIPVFYNGSQVEEITNIQVAGENGIQPIDTLVNNLSGFTSGSGRVTITLTIVVPIGGLEQDYWGDMTSEATVEMQIGVGAKSLIVAGKITGTDFGKSVNAGAEGTVTFLGELKDLK